MSQLLVAKIQQAAEKKTFLRGLSAHQQDSFRDFRQIYGLTQCCSQVPARSQRWSIGLRWRPFEYIVMFKKPLWDGWSFVTRHATLLKAAIRSRYTVVIKGRMWSGTKLRWPAVLERLVTKKPKCSGKISRMPLDQQFYQPFLQKARRDGSALSRSHPILTRPSKRHNGNYDTSDQATFFNKHLLILLILMSLFVVSDPGLVWSVVCVLQRWHQG